MSGEVAVKNLDKIGEEAPIVKNGSEIVYNTEKMELNTLYVGKIFEEVFGVKVGAIKVKNEVKFYLISDGHQIL
jgi:hypothetical protein